MVIYKREDPLPKKSWYCVGEESCYFRLCQLDSWTPANPLRILQLQSESWRQLDVRSAFLSSISKSIFGNRGGDSLTLSLRDSAKPKGAWLSLQGMEPCCLTNLSFKTCKWLMDGKVPRRKSFGYLWISSSLYVRNLQQSCAFMLIFSWFKNNLKVWVCSFSVIGPSPKTSLTD